MQKNLLPLPSILTITKAQLSQILGEWNEPNYRVDQIWDWLWHKRIANFDEMFNIPKPLKEKLKTAYCLDTLKINTEQTSTDKTIKLRLSTIDNYFIESVFIPTETRRTGCISSQIGCSLTCKFCATGKMGRRRNLTANEIVEQVNFLNRVALKQTNRSLTNLVFMGMGEPLFNYQTLLKSIERITSPDFIGMSPKRITVSTAGLAKQITQLAKDKVGFNLALSLHAADDKKRNEIMPINQSNNLKNLQEALNQFYKETANEISLEYILFRKFNDTEEDLKNLIKFYRQVPIKMLNIIEYNHIGDTTFKKPTNDETELFINKLRQARINVRLRKSRGSDIDAACGQLANKK